MLAKIIPATGESLPAIGIGTYRGFDLADTGAIRARLAEIPCRMFASGGAIVDSSPIYGRAETRAGTALATLGKIDDACTGVIPVAGAVPEFAYAPLDWARDGAGYRAAVGGRDWRLRSLDAPAAPYELSIEEAIGLEIDAWPPFWRASG